MATPDRPEAPGVCGWMLLQSGAITPLEEPAFLDDEGPSAEIPPFITTINARELYDLQADAGALKGGSFIMDMSSIKVEDLTDAKQNGDLVGHLKSPDFFAVDSHKVANFVITSVEALPAADAEGNTHSISGNLTIKGITNGIKFPAMVQMDAASVKANAKFDIDRTLWNIRYGSGKFFKGLGDKMINDNITLNINLQATAK